MIKDIFRQIVPLKCSPKSLWKFAKYVYSEQISVEVDIVKEGKGYTINDSYHFERISSYELSQDFYNNDPYYSKDPDYYDKATQPKYFMYLISGNTREKISISESELDAFARSDLNTIYIKLNLAIKNHMKQKEKAKTKKEIEEKQSKKILDEEREKKLLEALKHNKKRNNGGNQ